jgi:hypothetical protein
VTEGTTSGQQSKADITERVRQLAAYQEEFSALRCRTRDPTQKKADGKRRVELLALMKSLRG